MNGSPDSLGVTTFHLLSRVEALASRRLNRYMEQRFGVTACQARLLHVLSMDRGTGVCDLANATGIDVSAVSRMVARARKSGLLVCNHGLKDRRIMALTLTEKGRDVARAMSEISHCVERELFSDLTIEEVGFLRTMLDRIKSNSCSSGHSSVSTNPHPQ
ncbi:hypothetical protein GQ56_0126885 [Burkholderia paludis]|nr:hypothetical protein GQ56_0126885 [Burkholderia paludis]